MMECANEYIKTVQIIAALVFFGYLAGRVK